MSGEILRSASKLDTQKVVIVYLPTFTGDPMAITCIIKYEIDPYKKSLFEQYARSFLKLASAPHSQRST